jgi:hypothetical protein
MRESNKLASEVHTAGNQIKALELRIQDYDISI